MRGLLTPRGDYGFAGLATLIGVAFLAAVAMAAPAPTAKVDAIAAAPQGAVAGFSSGAIPVGTLYSNTGPATNQFYAGQGGHEAIDDLHMVSGGSPDSLTFEYHDPAVGGTFSATVRLYGNPSGLDLDATPLLATYVVSGLSRGRQIVSVPLPGAPLVGAAIWVGVQFTSTTAGLIINDVPSVGSSHDLYLEDGGFYNFGGSPRANFALRVVDNPLFGLTVSTLGSGLVTRNIEQPQYAGGTLVQLTATADPHWHFVGWSGDAAGSDNPLSLLMDGDKTITATFAIDTYTLAYAAGANGTVSGAVAQTVAHGADGSPVTALPDAGYAFTGWSDGVLTATRTDLAVTANLSVVANFTPDLVNLLSVTTVGAGLVNRSPAQSAYAANATVQLTAVADPHWHFVGWSGDATGSDNPLSLVMNGGKAVTATFELDTYTLAYSAGVNGTLSGTVAQTVAHGADGSPVTAVPDAGFAFTGWSDGVLTATRTDLAVTANLSVVANFAPAVINQLTVTAVGNGLVARSPEQPLYATGAMVQLTATADPHWHFVSWSGDASGSDNPLSLLMDGDKTITATFAIDTYTLAYAAGANGTVSGAVAQMVAHGADGSPVTAVPDAGFTFTSWSDGVLTATRTDLGVTANLSVVANFSVQIEPTIIAEFENGLLGWKGQGGGKLQLSEEGEGHAGSAFAARLVGPNSRTEFGIGDSPRFVTNTGPAGRQYRLSAWVRSETARGTVRIRAREYHSPSTVEDLFLPAPPPMYSSEVPLSSSWQELVLELTTERDNASFDLQILDLPQARGEVFLVDDIKAVASAIPDQAPRVHAPRKVNVAAGATLSVDVRAVDPDGQPIASLTATSFAAVIPQSFTPSADNRTGRLLWRSAPEEIGNTYTVTFQAENALNGAATMEIRVVEPATDANLCSNGTFEQDTLGWAALGNAAIARASEGRTGGHALQIRGGMNAWKFGSSDNPGWIATTASTGAVYRCSLYVKSTAHQGSARIEISEFVGDLLVGTTSSSAVTLSTGWQLLKVGHTVLSAGSTLRMYVSNTPVAGNLQETFLVDDVSITMAGGAPTPTPKPTPYVDPAAAAPASPTVMSPPAVHPNPAFGRPILEFSLAAPSVVRAEIFDTAGRRVQVLAADRELRAGTHRLAIQQDHQGALGAGIYFYRVQTAGTVQHGRFVILE